jgi:hypothetical protein
LRDVQFEPYAELLTRADELLELTPEQMAVSDRIADEWIERMTADGLAVVDLRAAFAASEVPLYWYADLHINLDGHRLAAAEVLPAVERALGL